MQTIDINEVFEKIELEILRDQLAAKDKQIERLTRRVAARDRTIKCLRDMRKRDHEAQRRAAPARPCQPDSFINALGGRFDSDNGGWSCSE